MDDIKRGDPAAGPANPLRAILSERDAIGALSRHVDVLVLDISRSGCLIETSTHIPPGTLAVVRVEVDGVEYSDAVRVTRSQPLQGAADRHRIGAEFAWLWAPEARSLRRLASWIGIGGVPGKVREPA